MDQTDTPNPREAAGPPAGPIDRRRSRGRRAEDLRPPGPNIPAWSLRELYRVLFRYRKRSLAFFVGVLAVVALGLAVAPRKYRSEAWLFVRLGRESVSLDPTATTGAFVGPNVTRENEINSIIQVMGSRALLAKVADKVGLTAAVKTPLERDRLLTRLAEDIEIFSPKNTSVIGVSTRARSPYLAQKIVAVLVDTYLDEHLRLNSTPGSYEFFDEQSKLLKEQLDKATAALRDAKSRYNLASIEGRRAALQQQISSVESQILDTQSSMAASEAKMKAMRGGLEKLSDSVLKQFALPNSNATNLREVLYELQTREQELLAKYTEQHPAVIAIRQQVREAERILRSEQPDRAQATSAALLAERSNYESLEARAASLKKQLAQLRRDVDALNEQEVQIRELERQVKVAETNYLTYRSSLEQTRVDRALDRERISNINIIQPASLVLKPVSPKFGLTLAIAAVVGALGAVGLALASDQLDHSLKSPEDIEKRLGLATLVSIPYRKPGQFVLPRAS